VQSIPPSVGKPAAVLADCGYGTEEHVKTLEAEGIEPYISTGAESQRQTRAHDLRPRPLKPRPPKEPKAEWLRRMNQKLEQHAARRLYALRKQTVEPVFGTIKQTMGFRQFLLRGLDKVSGEWELVVLAYNIKRLWTLKTAMS
jgi:hypothetical protein